LARAYGTRIEKVIGDAKGVNDLGQNFGADLTEREVLYLKDQEWARAAQDVLWRRSKLGLHAGPDAEPALSRWFADQDKAAPLPASGEVAR
jgi:glycerol-3-phosphate dehydrogenase